MKLFKNRTVLGIFCIVISLLICFAVTPLYNAGLTKRTTIVRFTKDVKAGEEIKRNMVAEVEVGNYNLPENIYRSIAEVEGKYLTMDAAAGDYILSGKISEEPAAENKYLYSLNGEEQAMSVTISTFAEGLSGKLRSGDIVSVIAPDYLDSGETLIPAELKYVEVIAVTAKSGNDANTEEEPEEEEELPSTVTLLVRPEQSKLLARLESEGEMHLSLVFRGTAEKAAEFIKAQEEVLTALAEPDDEEAADGEESLDDGTAVDGDSEGKDSKDGSLEQEENEEELNEESADTDITEADPSAAAADGDTETAAVEIQNDTGNASETLSEQGESISAGEE